MKNTLKKIMALGIAGAMMMGMSVTTFAAGGTQETPVRTQTAAAKMDIPITKTIYFYNADGAKVYEPNVTYTYTVTAADPGDATITDHEGHTAAVKAGVMDAFSTDSLSLVFSTKHAPVTAPATGIGVTKANSIEFDSDALKDDEGVITPGVYRYVITESDSGKAAKGVIAGEAYDNTLILDVFVTNEGVTGATIHDPKGTDGNDPDDPEDETIDNSGNDKTDQSGKTTGFGGGDTPTEPDGNDPEDDNPDDPGADTPTGQTSGTTNTVPTDAATKYDTYTTYNFTLQKTIDGAMADGSHAFPFAIAISNTVAGAEFEFFGVDATAGTKTIAAATTNLSANIKATETVSVKGVPTTLGTNNATQVAVKVEETNDTEDKYTVSATADGTAMDMTATTTSGTTTGTSVAVEGGKKASNTTAVVLTAEASKNAFIFQNALEAVSPTGVVLRFAPYVILLGAAIVLLMATRRRRAH